MDDAREIGRTVKAAERVLGWVAGAPVSVTRVDVLAVAQGALTVAAERLVSADRERAIEEAEEALALAARAKGDAALIALLIHAALVRALAGDGGPRPPRRPAAALRLAA